MWRIVVQVYTWLFPGKHLLYGNICIYNGQQAIIGHQQLSNTVWLYGVFLHTGESR